MMFRPKWWRLALSIVVLTAWAEGVHAQAARNRPQPGDQLSPKAVVRNATIAYRRARSVSDEGQRTKELRQLSENMLQRVEQSGANADLQFELLAVVARAQFRLEGTAAAEPHVKRQHALLRGKLAPTEFAAKIDQHTDRHRNGGLYDLAVMHMKELIAHDADPRRVAERNLVIGDILVQKAFPDGTYAPAIQHYAQVAAQYAKSFADIAEVAKFRQAKTLFRAGRIDEADPLFEALGATASEAIAEPSRHYRDIMRKVAERRSTAARHGDKP